NVGANGSYVLYDALLPHIASDDEVDRVSTAGYALGYIGGGLLLALNLAWITRPDWFGLPSGPGLNPEQATPPARWAFLPVAFWWLLSWVPLSRRVPEPKPAGLPPGYREVGLFPIRAAIDRIIETGRALGRYRQAVILLIAFLIYNDGIGTIMRMATIYATQLNFDQGVTIASILLVQFVGIPCAFLFGMLARRLRAKPSIAP